MQWVLARPKDELDFQGHDGWCRSENRGISQRKRWFFVGKRWESHHQRNVSWETRKNYEWPEKIFWRDFSQTWDIFTEGIPCFWCAVFHSSLALVYLVGPCQFGSSNGVFIRWGYCKSPKIRRNPARAKSQHQRPFPVKGGTRCKGWTENGKHTANYNVLAVCQGNVTLRIAVDNHVAWSPLAEWKDNGIQKQQCCQSCFESYRSWKTVQQEQA